MIPTGTVTFLFTDIEGSTILSQQFPDKLPAALIRHNEILNEVIETCNGFVFKKIGDAYCCAFENVSDALTASVEIQKRLSKEDWNDSVIKIRMGIHSGNAEWNGDDYIGYITLARVTRVMSAAYGEQILISNDAYETYFHHKSAAGGSKPQRKKESDNDSLIRLRRISSAYGGLAAENLSFRDLGERRLKDLIQPIRLFQVVSKELREDFPPLKTLDARPNNLKVQLTNFIGRGKELKQVKEFLKNSHLLTLTGSGGAGKTRFALQAGADLIDDFDHGVWFVELAALSDPFFLPQSFITALSLKEEQNKTPLETLTAYLKDKETLIILDNCEHLIEACAALSEKLLLSCPKLKIIATSREALKCSGEQIYRIPSLSQPDPAAHKTSEEIIQYESVRLFIERALAVNPEFRVTNENAPALAEICSRLDGMPLAIELAAARTKVLSLENIYERLDDRFNLLTGGIRTALPRQKTLRALIDWSYDLLSEKEKSLWSILSVFTGGWTLDAAEEICTDQSITKTEIVDLLYQLSEKSIISFDENKVRYSMLETIKQYGREKLKNKNEIYKKYLNYFLKLSKIAESELSRENAKLWLDILEADHNNFQAAIEWCVNNKEPENGSQVAAALGKFWHIRGYYSIGRRLLEKLLNNLQGVDLSAKGTLLNWAAELAAIQGDYEQARKFCEENLSLLRQLKDTRGVAITLSRLGNISNHRGEYEQARKFCEESLDLFRKLKDHRETAKLLNSLGSVVYNQGDYKQAQKFFEMSLTLKRGIGDKHSIAVTLTNLGLVALKLGELEEARKFNEESLILGREIGDKRGMAYSLSNLGEVEYISKNYMQSQKYFQESLELRLGMGLKNDVAESFISLAGIFFENNNYSRSALLLGAADKVLESIGSALNKDTQKLKYETIAKLHEYLRDEEFKKYWDEGMNMTVEEAAQLIVDPPRRIDN